jgi:reticulon-4-interacting protein 1, mitochondrial
MDYPSTNKALRFTTPGSVIEVVEKDVPPLPANELLIKVHNVSINPCDVQMWKSPVVGLVAGDKGIGRDYSGTVVAVGSNVKGWSQGDKVFGLLFQVVCSLTVLTGTYADALDSLAKGLSVNT